MFLGGYSVSEIIKTESGLKAVAIRKSYDFGDKKVYSLSIMNVFTHDSGVKLETPFMQESRVVLFRDTKLSKIKAMRTILVDVLKTHGYGSKLESMLSIFTRNNK